MFTPIETLLGGVFLHLATSQFLTDTGRVFGISSIVDGAVLGQHEGWRLAATGGLVVGPLVGALTGLTEVYPGHALLAVQAIDVRRIAVAGVLVGLGSRLGSGCTSGHMLCGVSRLSPRSLVSTAIFFSTAVLVANLFPSSPVPSLPTYALNIPSVATIAAIASSTVAAKLLYKAITSWTFSTATDAPSAISRLAPYFLAGLTFSLGLSISGMTDPSKVAGFLRFPTPFAFDPSLVMVMVGGVLPNAIHYASTMKKAHGKPEPALAWEQWNVPSRRDIDWRLVMGAVVFGAGWGLAGICPGPALVSLGEVVVSALGGGVSSAAAGKVSTFAISMLGGMALEHQI
ncbi:hypothetical protein L198_00733 [Cryptococcus wingfieldii CBS 7118]|uniref:Uncharacterized protein n=1 Tax=Cryptococcus wingfieldii CBS 7118 TaxID=1295528 RepID=A0A1E3K1W9_9TREE|nr:hypothetical protein L198_00733 [Cryptococcus wingfieldii CBS 7118]ODO07154.1 hypothetical protein L198_00733 [Cryptococcus wingfieldii CBS 7118]